MSVLVIIVVILAFITILASLRLVNQYERGVVFRLGRVRTHVKEPGLRMIIPYVDQMRKVSTRIITLPIEPQSIITKDNVSISVSAVAFYRVVDPTRSIVEIENVVAATYQIAQTTVRNIVGQSMLDEVLGETTAINEKIKMILEIATEKCGN